MATSTNIYPHLFPGQSESRALTFDPTDCTGRPRQCLNLTIYDDRTVGTNSIAKIYLAETTHGQIMRNEKTRTLDIRETDGNDDHDNVSIADCTLVGDY